MPGRIRFPAGHVNKPKRPFGGVDPGWLPGSDDGSHDNKEGVAPIPILELCAGYGGLGVAVSNLTGERVAYVAEKDEHASRVLAARFPDAPNLGDIEGFDWHSLVGEVDIITAGWPCQDISNAGPREGISGKRSGLWKEVAEAIRVLRPRFVFLENVAVLRRRGLHLVAGDLARIGYDLQWTSLRASEVGAAHHRDRWFGLAMPAPERRAIAEVAYGELGCERSGPAPREAEGGGAWSNS